MKAFVIDISKCNGCYSCQIFYKAENTTSPRDTNEERIDMTIRNKEERFEETE